MKKIYTLGMVAMMAAVIASCSNKEEGVDAANDESVAGATDGVVVDEESVEMLLDEAPGQLQDAAQNATDAAGEVVEAGQVTVEETAAQGGNIVDKAEQGVKNAYDKTKDGVTNAYDKTKEGVKNAYDKTKEGVTNAYDATKDKAKELINKGKEKIHKATE